jgi:hypothetical protein
LFAAAVDLAKYPLATTDMMLVEEARRGAGGCRVMVAEWRDSDLGDDGYECVSGIARH